MGLGRKFKPYLNPEEELLVWGPVPGRVYFSSVYTRAFAYDFSKHYKGAWPGTVVLLKEGKLVWINEFPALRQAGREVFLKYVLPKRSRRRAKKRWLGIVDELVREERKIGKQDLMSMTDKELHGLAEHYYDLVNCFELPTIAPELGNYGSDMYLEEEIAKYVPERGERAKALEILTAPEELSFTQQEEIDLAAASDIKAHQQKYFWLRNNYAGEVESLIEFFAERKKGLSSDLRVKAERRLDDLKQNKQRLVEKYHLPRRIVEIADAIWEAMVWQDERKKHIYRSMHYLEMILEEVARRTDIELEVLKDALCDEVLQVLKGENVLEELKGRRQGFGAEFGGGKLNKLSVERVNEYWGLYVEKYSGHRADEVRGVVASSGRGGVVKGRVRIIKEPSESELFRQGEILVASMTSPEYVFAMRKAAAVVTDSGGLTSHAAIVSRELKIPCLVNTKVATKAFKNGDLVEVDAEKGVVRRI